MSSHFISRITLFLLAIAFIPAFRENGDGLLAQESEGLAVVDLNAPAGTGSTGTLQPELPKTKFVLTRHGIIQEGIVIDGEKAVYVQIPDQKGGITISKMDVLHIADTREELFEYRRSGLPSGNISELIKLADWAARNQLVLPAVIMLKEALDRSNDFAVRDSLEKKIQQLEFVEKIRLAAMVHREKLKSKTPEQTLEEKERKQLETWSRTIPMSVQDRFFKKIQPLLIKRCATRQCHGDPDGTFVLHRLVTGTSRRPNGLKNLRAVLDRVNSANPTNSPILAHPPLIDPDGKARYPFGNDGYSLRDYEAFTSWVNSLSGISSDPVSSGPEVAGPVKATAGVPQVTQPVKPLPPPVPLSDPVIQTGVTQDAARILGNHVNSPEQILKRSGTIPAIIPKDVYDPVLFNQRYHPERQQPPSP